ncbi:MAG TPA: hypothetical protein VGN57_18985 [Pirellulaceae bacterium]|nr:hypothetical protein [Pirellulaceae bacterium]
MEKNQPYDVALTVPCDLLLSIVQSRLDESLSYLEGDNPRLARKSVNLELEGGVAALYEKEGKRDAPHMR